MNQEVNKIVQELYTCLPNDRNKFNSIMENLKEKFLSSSNNRNLNYNIKLPSSSFTSQIMNDNLIKSNSLPNINNNINTNNTNYLNNSSDINPSLNPLKEFSNFQPINLPTYNVQNKQYESLNNDELGDYININNINNTYQTGTFNDNLYDNNIKNDIHANCKYYYPEEYNTQINDNKYQNIDLNNNKYNNTNLMYGSKSNFYKNKNDFN